MRVAASLRLPTPSHSLRGFVPLRLLLTGGGGQPVVILPPSLGFSVSLVLNFSLPFSVYFSKKKLSLPHFHASAQCLFFSFSFLKFFFKGISVPSHVPLLAPPLAITTTTPKQVRDDDTIFPLVFILIRPRAMRRRKKITVFSPNTPDKSKNSQYTLNVTTIHRIPFSFRKRAPDTLFLTSVKSQLALFTILPSLNSNPNLT